MNDTERLILIRALATNCRENAKNEADEDNRPLLDLIHELSFGMKLEVEIDYSLGTSTNFNSPNYSAPNWDDPINLVACLRGLAENVQHYCERDRLLILRGALELEKRID